MQPRQVAHARGGGWRCVRKDLLHNPAGNAALLRDLRTLQSIVIVVPRLHLRCYKEVEGGESGDNVVRRDLIRGFSAGASAGAHSTKLSSRQNC